jgi:dipeptidyl-peptidase-4
MYAKSTPTRNTAHHLHMLFANNINFFVMRFAFIFCLLLVFIPQHHGLVAQSQITLDEVFKKGTFRTKTIPAFNFTPDGQHYTTLEKEGIVEWNMDATRNRLLFDTKITQHAIKEIDAYELSKSQKHLLLFSDAKPLYRHSALGTYHVYDLTTSKLTAVKSPGPARDAQLSPDGTRVAFVSLNNLYVYHIATGKLISVTTDGKTNAIINGVADWVYEEEFGQSRYFEWSPDGRHIAFIRFDESKVPTMTIEYHNDTVYPQPYTYKYPKVGQNNATVAAYIYDTKTKKTNPVALAGSDFYIPRIKWATNNEVVVFQLNRLQNDLQLWLADASRKAQARLLYREQEARTRPPREEEHLLPFFRHYHPPLLWFQIPAKQLNQLPLPRQFREALSLLFLLHGYHGHRHPYLGYFWG